MESTVDTLKDGTVVTLFFVPGEFRNEVPRDLVEQMHKLFNLVIEEGQTYPHQGAYSFEDFVNYWMSYFCTIMVRGEHTKLEPQLELLGTNYVKPNYVGRCSHVANAGFLVEPKTRGLGVAKTLGKHYLVWGKKLGYEYSVFNLVFETNIASLKVWDSLGFERIGRIPDAAHLKGYDKPVAAIMFGKSFIE